MNKQLFWHQGLFLQPQHFQRENLFFQSLLAPFHKFLQPFFWGIGGVEIQETELDTFSFRLLKGEFLFPDNTHVVYPGNAVAEPRTFDDAWVEGGKPFTVFAGVKKLSEVSENVTVLEKMEDFQDVSTRFVAAANPEDVPDLYQGGTTAQVKSLFYLIKIFWETETAQLGDYSLIPIAQIERSGDGVRLSEQFAPPCLMMSGSGLLQKLVKEVYDQVSSRGHQLESYKRDRGIHSAEFGARDMVYLLALRTIGRYVPVLSHLTESGQMHPWNVYAVLRQLVGELSSFSGQVNMIGELEDGTSLLADYDHQNLWGCFSSAQAVITRLLDEITAGPEYVIPLDYDGTYYTGELSPDVFDGRNRFYMIFATDEDPQTVLQALESFAKLGSRESLPLLIARSLPGIKLEHLPAPPLTQSKKPSIF